MVVQDDGGTANGGDDTSAIQTFTITVTAVNDEPSFTATNPAASNEDGGAQTVSAWASFNAGPNEGSQSVLSYTVSNVSNPGLFSTPPAVATDGTLSYTAAADEFGSSTFDVLVQDDGGTANGGDDTSLTQTFTITVNSVNDEPDFTAANPATVLEDAGAQTVAGWVTAFDPGPANESGQGVLGYTVDNLSNAALFSVAPSVASNGTLTYTPAANASGSSTFEVVVQDDGGTANGGDDTSAIQTFTITVTAVNDEPSFTATNPAASNEDGGAQTVSAWASFNAGPNEGSQSVLSYTVSGISNPGLFSTPPAVATDGTLRLHRGSGRVW
ncbi:MAG: hypothetical protein IPO08_11770 [Xanthomonadales bacterium]|nr:hypothetical protein [Xanthomonadales bacterium]